MLTGEIITSDIHRYRHTVCTTAIKQQVELVRDALIPRARLTNDDVQLRHYPR